MAGEREFDLGIAGLAGATRIGEGGNAVVYRARQPALDRDVAVKILKGASDEDIRRRFDRERKAMGRLSQHDGIVTVYDGGFTDRDEPYIVMPLLAGSLDDAVAESGPMAWSEAAATMADVCRTVGYAHRQGIVHRDIKPANIMRARSGRPLVADFGISRIMDAKASHRSTALTLTPAFSPPESLEAALVAPRSDIYSLGATLYALLAGHPPFVEPGRDTPLLVLMRRIMEDPVPPIDGAPAALQAIVATAMAKDPSQRFTSAEDMAAALEALAGSLDRVQAESNHAVATGGTGRAGRTVVVDDPGIDATTAKAAATRLEAARNETVVVAQPPGDRRRLVVIVGAAALVAVAAVALLVSTRGSGESVVAGTADGAQAATVAALPATAAATADTASTSVSGNATSETAEFPDPEPALPPVAAMAGELVGPVDIEPYVSALAASEESLWVVAPRGGDTVSRIDAPAVTEAERYDLGFLPVRVAVNDRAIYGSDISGRLARLDRATGEVTTVQMDQPIGYLDVDSSWLWVETSTEGLDARLRRLDPVTLAETATVEVGDYVFNLASAGSHVWMSESSTLIGRNADTLEPLPAARPPLSSIDDLDAVGGIVWATGGQFDSELSDAELSIATVVAYDAATGTALFETAVSRDLSIFDQLDVAATEDGAWVTNETSSTATFVDLSGAPIRSVGLPENTISAVVFDGDLWILAGAPSTAQLYRLTP